MSRHGFVTRDSRVASHDLSQCPDPTRPDPLLVTAVSGDSGTTSIDLTVGVESPPEAWMDTSLLEDWEPPCEYSEHDRFGAGPAAWAVFYAPIATCGCPLPSLVLYCACCWEARNAFGAIRCECGAFLPATADIIRIEAL